MALSGLTATVRRQKVLCKLPQTSRASQLDLVFQVGNLVLHPLVLPGLDRKWERSPSQAAAVPLLPAGCHRFGSALWHVGSGGGDGSGGGAASQAAQPLPSAAAGQGGSNGAGGPAFERGLDSGLAKAAPSAQGLNQKTYRSFRRRLDLFSRQCKRRGTSVAVEGAFLVFSQLQDVAWDASESIDMDDVELSDDPFSTKMLASLDEIGGAAVDSSSSEGDVQRQLDGGQRCKVCDAYHFDDDETYDAAYYNHGEDDYQDDIHYNAKQ
eukprot:s447_g19.t1